jgi:hypothetical protein
LGQLFANQAGKNWFKMIKSMVDHLMPIAIIAFQTINKYTQDGDIIVHSFLMTDAEHTIAQKLGIPDISAQLFPVFLSTGEFAPVALPDLPLGKYYRSSMHKRNSTSLVIPHKWATLCTMEELARLVQPFQLAYPIAQSHFHLINFSGPKD